MEEKLVITCMNHGLLYSLRYKTNNNSLTCLKDLNVQQLLVDVELDQMWRYAKIRVVNLKFVGNEA